MSGAGLAARNVHVPAQGRAGVAAIENEIVALWLELHGAVEGGVKRGWSLTPQHLAQIHHVLLAQAQVELAGRGEPDAVAGLAKIVTHRRNKPDQAIGFLDPIVTRRATAAMIGRLERVP